MYKRNAQGWSKHFDFFVLDEICLQIAFCLAGFLRHSALPYSNLTYRILAYFLIVTDAFIIISFNTMHNVISRGYFNELVETVKQCFAVFAIAAIFMFATQSGDDYSRIVLFLTFGFHILIGYLIRLLWKAVLKSIGLGRPKKSMLVVTSYENAEELLAKLTDDQLAGYGVTGVVLTDRGDIDEISGYKVISTVEDAPDYIVRNWVDSVYVDASLGDERIHRLMDECNLMAVPTHYRVKNLGESEIKRFPEKIGHTTVLTTSINYVTPFQAFYKRLFDIFAGIIGSVIAILLIIIFGPIIKLKSPGPILFKQERVGHNGQRFNIVKLRTMYMDAEERKKELMDQNKMDDDLMFKMDFDPRIIGNKVLPDGTKKTGIGEFLRRTSLDEFPQFFLVLAGIMSTVGTRPPTVDEYNKYDYHHRARMAIKPGITGLWQVSGRSNITNFEDVVRLDTDYIVGWSVGMDIKILVKTIGVLFTGKGAI
ncbi:MAG: sugar transferase [Butyrivibrio sp.]|nr:sugar transferase [Butyrivibrio sp.]